MSRRGFGDDAVYFDHSGDCRDARYHTGCPGRWHGAVSIGYGYDGTTWRRHKVSGRTRAEVAAKLRQLQAEQDSGVHPEHGYTVQRAVDANEIHGVAQRSQQWLHACSISVIERFSLPI